LQDDEIEVGTETLWVSKEKAIELIESSVWNNLYDKYVIERSVVFLKAI
jgi:hypothetical protein